MPYCYLDHAATSFPKPKSVLQEVFRVAAECTNPGRGGHLLSRKSGWVLEDARESLAQFLHTRNRENIIFTAGATAGLNMAILGTVEALRKTKRKPCVLTSVLEHNSVSRPLFSLEDKGDIELRFFSPSENGSESDYYRFLTAFPGTDLVVLTACSNTTGHMFPLKKIVSYSHNHGVPVILDGAQLIGSEDFSLDGIGADIVCIPSHKGLLGIPGAGVMAFSSATQLLPAVILSGGSGKDSRNRSMPSDLPERFEAGTLPLPLIAGMAAGAKFLSSYGLQTVSEHERSLRKLLLDGLQNIPKVRLYDPASEQGPILFTVRGIPTASFADFLDKRGVYCRAGLHCSPLSHRFFGTEKEGALRLSVGLSTTGKDADFALKAISDGAR